MTPALFHLPKRYGESKLPACPFCSKSGTVRNSQGIPVCEAHRGSIINNLKCACSSNLELKIGRWGPYGICQSCGNVSWSKICEINSIQNKTRPEGGRVINLTSNDCGVEAFDQRPKPEKVREITMRSCDPEDKPYLIAPKKKKEITIRSDDVNYF